MYLIRLHNHLSFSSRLSFASTSIWSRSTPSSFGLQLPPRRSQKDEPDQTVAVRHALTPAWREPLRSHFSQAWPHYLPLPHTSLGATAVILTARVSMHMLAQLQRVWPFTFFTSPVRSLPYAPHPLLAARGRNLPRPAKIPSLTPPHHYPQSSQSQAPSIPRDPLHPSALHQSDAHPTPRTHLRPRTSTPITRRPGHSARLPPRPRQKYRLSLAAIHKTDSQGGFTRH